MDIGLILGDVLKSPVMTGVLVKVIVQVYLKGIEAINNPAVSDKLKPVVHLIMPVLSFLAYHFSHLSDAGGIPVDPAQAQTAVGYYLNSLAVHYTHDAVAKHVEDKRLEKAAAQGEATNAVKK